MKNLSFLTEAELLETFRISLENVRNQSEIATIMAEFGYPSEIITEGESLFNIARLAYDHNKQEGNETSKSYLDFMQAKSELSKIYSNDRKIAKVVFRNDPATRINLALNGEIPAAYLTWLEVVRKLYQELSHNPELQAKVAPLKLSKEKILDAINLITIVESTRAEYIKELGESQQSKVQKDHAFAQLESWMREFYAVAKIAFEDNEGLLKAIRS
ncbi:MAG: hypothetical protein H6Q25_1092 [Bacteroidetes bacterium]|nr:hypothetical protein [Bacteroidota bacterium]